MGKIVILAFLQNMWVKDPERVRKELAAAPHMWRYMIKNFLFSGCKTGSMIQATFGKDLAYSIIYEECTKEIAGNARKVCKPDSQHIYEAIHQLRPQIIITFGKIATEAVKDCIENDMRIDFKGDLIQSPHPAARQPDTLEKLLTVSEVLKIKIQQWRKVQQK